MASFVWSVEKTFNLIKRYKAHPCLYNMKHQDYHDKNPRSNLGEIAANLDVPGTLSMKGHAARVGTMSNSMINIVIPYVAFNVQLQRTDDVSKNL